MYIIKSTKPYALQIINANVQPDFGMTNAHVGFISSIKYVGTLWQLIFGNLMYFVLLSPTTNSEHLRGGIDVTGREEGALTS